MNDRSTAAATESNIPAQVKGRGFAASIFLSPLNQRVQVLDYEAEDLSAMVACLASRARESGFGKVFLKAPHGDKPSLEDAGMCCEAVITGYFSGQPAAVMSLFLNEDRRHRPCADEEDEILQKIRERPADASVPPLPDGYTMNPVELGDAVEVAELYHTVFASYPFPITDPDYIRTTMRENVRYRIVRDNRGTLVGAASAETDPDHSNAEMTDFATLPDQRGLGLAQHILDALERDMSDQGIDNLYTIARARSAGMNRVFYNRGYELTGTLVNNCHIAGQFEDMHVWCRPHR